MTGPRRKPAAWVELAILIISIALFVQGALFWIRYQLVRMTPGDWGAILAMGCLAAGGAWFLWTRLGLGRPRVKTCAGAGLFGMLVGGGGLLAANAWLDASPERVLAVRVLTRPSCSRGRHRVQAYRRPHSTYERPYGTSVAAQLSSLSQR
jgi:hypothetical protein